MRKRRISMCHHPVEQETQNWKQKYDELSERHLCLQKELMDTHNEYTSKYSEHMNTLHFLQNKNEALNQIISQKNGQISGLLFAKNSQSPPLSDDDDDDDPKNPPLKIHR